MSVEAAVAKVLALWDDGLLARGEVVSRLSDLLTATNVAEIVAAVPDSWRAQFVEHLRSIGEEGPSIRIFGAISTHEYEHDPARRAEMKAEVARQHAAEDTHFEEVVRPAIRAWVLQQG